MNDEVNLNDQGVAVTGRNCTVPPCSVGRRTGRDRPRALQMTTDDSVQNNTGPLGGPVISMSVLLMVGPKYTLPRRMLTPGAREIMVCRGDRRTDTRPLHYALHYDVASAK